MNKHDLTILYVGESWLGSCARSLKEALSRHPDVELDEVNEDLYFPRHAARWLRGVHRLLRSSYRRDLYDQILAKVRTVRPEYVIAYKGSSLDSEFIIKIRALGVKVIDIYPDCSPHAHGGRHHVAVGVYDLVISTKRFHPRLWRQVYGYRNSCEFVPQGYDPALHLVPYPSNDQPYDLVLVATWRAEYGDLMKKLAAALDGQQLCVAIGGNGWIQRRGEYPENWIFGGELQGRSYVDWLRKGKICLSPVTREVLIGGVRQPGDEDTTRTYELAAAHCFFIHRRTEFAKSLYDEAREVPMYDTAEELAEKIRYFLSRPAERESMAARAHERAVPAYSLDSRASAIVNILQRLSESVGDRPNSEGGI